MLQKSLITKIIIVSLVIFGAALKVNYSKKKSNYAYKFPIEIDYLKKENEKFSRNAKIYQKRFKKNQSSFKDTAIMAQLYFAHGKRVGLNSYILIAQNYAYKSLHIMPLNNTTAYYVLADIALYEDQFQKSIIYAQRMLKEKPKSPEAFLILGKGQLALGNFIEANQYADELISIMPSENAYTLRAMVLAAQGRNEEAVFDFEEAIRVEENDALQAIFTRISYARFLMKNTSKNNENLKYAEELLKEALIIDPKSPLSLGLMGDLLSRNNKSYKISINYYKAAFSESKQLHYLLKEAYVHKLMGEDEFAMTLYNQTEALLRQNITKNKYVDQNLLIRLLLERENPSDYPESLRIALVQNKFRNSPESLILLAWAFEVNNHLFEARKVVRELLAKNIRNEDVYLRAISIEEKLKNSSLAKLYRNNFLSSSI